MPTSRQYLSLLAILVGGLALSGLIGGERTLAPAHWPAADDIYEVDGWTMQPAVVEADSNVQQSLAIVQRTYARSSTGERATLVIWTQPQPQAKTLLRKGPDRDFLGAGYTSEPAPAELVPFQPGRGALIARQGNDAWLVLYAYGERRGLLAMDLNAWVSAESDAFLDQPNDYFLARVLLPFDASLTPPPIAQATSLADVLFPRLASWYRELH